MFKNTNKSCKFGFFKKGCDYPKTAKTHLWLGPRVSAASRGNRKFKLCGEGFHGPLNVSPWILCDFCSVALETEISLGHDCLQISSAFSPKVGLPIHSNKWSICRQLPTTFLVPCVAARRFCRKRSSPSTISRPTWAVYPPRSLSAQGPHMPWKQPRTATNAPRANNANKNKNQRKHWITSYAKFLIPSMRFLDASNESRHGLVFIPQLRSLVELQREIALQEATKVSWSGNRGQRFVCALGSNARMSRKLFKWMPHRDYPWTSCTANTSWTCLCKSLAFALPMYKLNEISLNYMCCIYSG